jgi:hypothetical protein
MMGSPKLEDYLLCVTFTFFWDVFLRFSGWRTQRFQLSTVQFNYVYPEVFSLKLGAVVNTSVLILYWSTLMKCQPLAIAGQM